MPDRSGGITAAARQPPLAYCSKSTPGLVARSSPVVSTPAGSVVWANAAAATLTASNTALRFMQVLLLYEDLLHRPDQTVKLSPQPQLPVALGFWNTKPAVKSSSTQSIVEPIR